MIRTQIYITENERQELRVLSRQTGKSQSELIRDAIDQFIKSQQYKKQNKLLALKAAKGLWEKRDDLPNFKNLRKEFDREDV